MDPALRVVTQIPLAELWTASGTLRATRARWLGRDDVASLLRTGPVQFVIADGGQPLAWIPVGECYVQWKLDVRSHLVVDPNRPFDIYTFPEGYAYVASEWRTEEPTSSPIVLLEKHH